MEYYTERISKENFSAFLKIFQISFNVENIEYENFENKFDTHYTGSSFIGYIAFHISNIIYKA